MCLVYYCVIRTSLKILTHFEKDCEANAEGHMYVQTAAGLVNPHSTQLTPALQPCPLWDIYLLAWAVGSNAEGSCVSNGRVNTCALNLPFWTLAKLMLATRNQ